MIILRQKEYSLKKNIIESVLQFGNRAKKKALKEGTKSGSKQIANSLNKAHESRKTAEILEAYKNKPQIAKRKLEKLRNSRKGRKAEMEKVALKKLNNLPNDIKTKEEISKRAEKIADQITIQNVANTAKQLPENTARSVMNGVKNIYENTGQIVTDAGVGFRKHPIAYPGWFSGDVVNGIATATGHPELVAVPVGTIVGTAGLAGETALFPRRVRRKFRQNAINYKKRRVSGQEKGKLTIPHDWSIKKMVQNNNEYVGRIGTAGNIGFIGA